MAKRTGTIIGILVLLPGLFFAIFWSLYSVNVPWFDDFEVLPDFLMRYLDASTLDEKLHWIFWPNNEHRMAYGKLLAVVLHALTGQMNFRWIQALANLSTLGLLGLFWGTFRRFKLPLVYFLPVPLLLFQPQYHLLSFWTITGIQHQPVLLFAFLSAYLLGVGSSAALSGALLAALVATFTMSNGMFAWVAGGVVLGLQGRWKGLGLWVVLALSAMGGYFYNFPNRANSHSFEQFLAKPYLSFIGFFTFWGGGLDFLPNLPIVQRAILPTLAGLALAGWMGFWLTKRGVGLSRLWRDFHKKASSPLQHSPLESAAQSRYFLMGALAFLGTNAVIIALLRPHFGYYVLLVSNYKLYCTLTLILAYLMLLEAQKGQLQPRRLRLYLTGSVLFCFFSYLVYAPDVATRRKNLLTGVYNQFYSGIGLGATQGDFGEKYIEGVFRQIINRGIYHWPDVLTPLLQQPLAEQSPLVAQIQFDAAALWVRGDAPTPPGSVLPNGLLRGAYLSLQGPQGHYLTPAFPSPHQGRNPFAGPRGFTARFDRTLLRPGTYRLTLYVVEEAHRLIAYALPQPLTI